MRDTTTVAHGYTLTDLDRLARQACAADRSLAADMTTRYDIAWSAIAHELAAADEPPHPLALVRAGWQAIYTEVREIRRLYGIPRDRAEHGVAAAPNFVIYWRGLRPDRAEERRVEEMAVHQILPTLGAPYRAAVLALAAHGTYQAAADALGITYDTMTARMRTARREFRRWWFAPESAPPTRGTDRRVGSYATAGATHCPAGHPWTPENTLWRTRKRAVGIARVRRCRACEHARDRARRSTEAVAA